MSYLKKIESGQARLHQTLYLLRLKNRVALMLRYLIAITNEFKFETRLPFRLRLKAWRRGMRAKTFFSLHLDASTDLTLYESDMEIMRKYYINGRHHEIPNNKLAFFYQMKHHGLPTPEVLGTIHGGNFFPMSSHDAIDPNKMLHYIFEHEERLFFKPIWGSSGHGAFCLSKDTTSYRIFNEELSVEQVLDLINTCDNYLVTTFACQSGFAASFFPNTPNTVRLVTLQNIDGSGAFISHAVFRAGTYRSYPFEQSAYGGVIATIDINSGELSMAAQYGENEILWHKDHPDTGTLIEGRFIPAWKHVREQFLRLANQLSYIPQLGWDVVLTDDDYGFTILECNSNALISQVHRPYYADNRVLDFYRHHGVIR